MIDQTHIDDATARVIANLKALNMNLDTWAIDAISASISIAATFAYQEGMRDAFLKMGSYIKK